MSEPTPEECIEWAERWSRRIDRDTTDRHQAAHILAHLRRIPALEALADTTQRDLARVTADDAHNCRLLLRLRDRLALIVWAIADEGDRVYFGSTNDADDLRDIARELDDVKWDRIMRGAEKPDLYAELRKLRRDLGEAERERDELRAENARLRGAVDDLHAALRGLSFAAQITGGTAGLDSGLEAQIANAEKVLTRTGGYVPTPGGDDAEAD